MAGACQEHEVFTALYQTDSVHQIKLQDDEPSPQEHVPVPYGYLVPVTSEDESFKVPEKQLLVCWVVSNWNSRHRRVQFYNELKRHVHVSVFGDAFGRRLSDGELKRTMSSCKFYLSFENSEHTDYIAEKLFGPMMLGTVPVVLGPPRKNYEDHVPADAFIHVDDFSSVKLLAERLRQLDHEDHEYRSFFNWTRRFRVHRSGFGPEHVCKTCRYLQTHRGQHVCPRLNKWFWC
ncbi:4-galactosyl-N-acetylglucosaminide 3-alpha-L-fucosyltransferase 9 [Pleuronectes platessa]|uniref:4-galactosyl-N-acetylglucosaminide 3-alpha-L-fucosyltransferase 9 n=1 Tax=Pleuronectes platessa TaxID=8262 RepID=UPI00232A7172|nr:4-galactosyl-N-acetylglucosaminide 3-alpha-L-fucosyltransferase 9 [Pleuronectes platessa]